MQENETSKDFKVVVTLPAWKAKMVKQELSKHGIPTKTTTHGGNVSWDEIRGGGVSPDIFMPPFPRDVYVPENEIGRAKSILAGMGIVENELTMPRFRKWQRVWAAFVLIVALSMFIALLISVFR